MQANSKDERLQARGGVGGPLTYVKKENQHAKQEGYGDENRCEHVCLHVRVCMCGCKGSGHESTRALAPCSQLGHGARVRSGLELKCIFGHALPSCAAECPMPLTSVGVVGVVSVVAQLAAAVEGGGSQRGR